MASARVSILVPFLVVKLSLSPEEEDLLAKSAKKIKPGLETKGEGSLHANRS